MSERSTTRRTGRILSNSTEFYYPDVYFLRSQATIRHTLSARGLENDLAHLHLGKHVTLDSSRNFSTSRIFYPRYISFQIGSLQSIKRAQQPDRKDAASFLLTVINININTYDLVVIFWQHTLSPNLRFYPLIFDYRFFIHGHQQINITVVQ